MSDNRPRRQNSDGVESWFLRANHPSEAKAIWLKATTFIEGDTALAEAWCSVFDGDKTWAGKSTVPMSSGTWSGIPLSIEIADCSFKLSQSHGRLQGQVCEGEDSVSWDLSIRSRVDLGQALCMLPSRRLIDAPVPKNKLLTPAPALRFDGTITWNGVVTQVDGWWGSQGHNWGPAHAKEYVWGQCVFLDANHEPYCFVEGASGRIEVAGQTTPIISLMTIRHSGKEYRFDRLLDLWNHSHDIAFPKWSLRMKGPDGEALLTMEAQTQRMVCLGYHNPGGPMAYCLNSKTAAVLLRMNPVNADAFECISEHGGALEFLQMEAEPSVQPVV